MVNKSFQICSNGLTLATSRGFPRKISFIILQPGLAAVTDGLKAVIASLNDAMQREMHTPNQLAV
jgi:hypothetical protein